jgi:hypothetical protein
VVGFLRVDGADNAMDDAVIAQKVLAKAFAGSVLVGLCGHGLVWGLSIHLADGHSQQMSAGSGKFVQFFDQTFFGNSSNLVYRNLGISALTAYLNPAAPALVYI